MQLIVLLVLTTERGLSWRIITSRKFTDKILCLGIAEL